MGRGRPRKEAEIEAPGMRPEMPEELTGDARAAWLSICDDLESLGLVQATDAKLIEVYARLYATFRRIERQLATEELTSVSHANGRTFINPLVSAQSEYAHKLRICLSELGLTPKSRKAKTDDIEENEVLNFIREQ